MADQATPEEQASFEALKSQSGGAQIGEITGQVAPFVAPGLGIGNIASLPARVAASSALGATEGGVLSAGQGGDAEQIVKGAILGGVIGAGGEAILPIANSVGRATLKKLGVRRRGAGARAVTPDGSPTPELTQALDSRGATVDDLVAASSPEVAGDPAANATRLAAFEKLGITPTEAQRTRDVDLFVEQQDQFRRGGKVRKALDEQETQLTERVANAVTDTGGAPRTSSQTIIEAVEDKSIRLDGEISSLYTEDSNRAAGEANVRPVKAIDSLKANAPLNTRSDGTVKAIRDQMQVMGVAKGFKSTGRIDVAQSEELRQFANSLFDGANPQGRKVIRDFKEGLDSDVFSAAGEDVFNSARQAKRNFERGLTKEAKNKFDRNKTSLVRDTLENKIAPEDYFNRAVKGKSKYKAADLMDLKRYLSEGTPEDVAAGQAAWNDLRAETMQFIKETSFTGPVRADGSQSLSRAQLQKAFSSIGNDKMNILFSQQERGFLKDLAGVASLKEPPPGTFTGSGPSSPAIDKLRKSLTGWIPFADEAVSSVQGKISEKRVLNLVDDVEKIRKRNAKEAFNTLRRSQLGEAAAAIPFAAIPAVQGEEK